MWYLVGMLLIGMGMSLIMTNYGVTYCLMGERNACLSMAIGFAGAPILLNLIITLASRCTPIAILLQAVCIPLSFTFYQIANKLTSNSSQHEAVDTATLTGNAKKAALGHAQGRQALPIFLLYLFLAWPSVW